MNEREIFIAALEQESPADRRAYLDRVCQDDLGLRGRVEELLGAHDRAGSFLNRPIVAPGPTGDYTPGGGRQAGAISSETSDPEAESGALSGRTIGPYKLLQQIGEGGMGTVWLAEQSQPVHRQVALKIIKAGMDSKQVLARFEAERQALALMDHPHIARVLDGGATDGGRPYFVMELVKGQSITRYCDEQRLTPRQRLELFVPVCQALQHAHQKGIIHRDVKPSNVLVAPYDGKAVVKVIDFGVAKATGQRLTGKTLFTELGAVVGTLEYMSPEQAELNNQDIDIRSDVYSLGVLLYELLTGTTPLTRERLKQVAFGEMLRLIREEEPPKPSTRLSSTDELPAVAARRGVEPRKLSGLVRGELDWIVMKALDKERGRRYESASAFAADLERYLADEPVQACPPSAGYRLRKFVRRNKGPVLAVSIIVLLLVAGFVGTTTGMFWALAAERQAVGERDQKEKALRQVITERDQKEEARRLTRQALNTTTDEVLEDLLAHQEQVSDQHREFLKKLLAFHAAFAADGAKDLVGRESRMDGFFRVGRLRQFLGQVKDAELAYGDALVLQKQLVKDCPDRPDFRRSLAFTYNYLGILQRHTGRPEEAEKTFLASLALHKQLVADFPKQPEFRHYLAGTYINLGILQVATGRLLDAEKSYREALGIQKQLATDFPTTPDFRRDLAKGQSNLGILLRDTGRPEDAENAYREALTLLKQLVDEFPTSVLFRQGLALTLNNLGILLGNMARLDEAEKVYRDAVVLQKQMAAQLPTRPDIHRDLAQSLNNLGSLVRRIGRLEEAEGAFRAALAIARQLTDDFPYHQEFPQELARTLNNIGLLLVERKKYPEAKESYREAMDLHKKLAADFPSISEHQNELASTLVNLAIVHNHCQEFAAAVLLVEQARPYHQAALKTGPRSPVYQEAYRTNLRVLAWSQVGLADHARLAAVAHDLAHLDFNPAYDSFVAACYLSLCTTLVEKDTRLNETRRQELAQNYADQALALLRQAVAHGFKDAAKIKRVSELEPVRAREEYRKLLAELEGKAKE
jgi:serine/threonine protein kinase/Tfp pilus assembly protein PilF